MPESGIAGEQALVRIDPRERPAALLRIPLTLMLVGLVLIAIQAGRPLLGLAVMLTALASTAAVAMRSLALRQAPATALRDQGDERLLRGEYHEARALYERALALAERELPPASPEVLVNYYGLAAVNSMLHDHARADRYLADLLRGLGNRVPPAWSGHVAWLLRRVAHHHSLLGHHVRAVALCHRALDLVGEAPGADDNTVRSLLDDLAWIHHHAGDYGRAEAMFRRALAIHEQFRDAAIELAQRPAPRPVARARALAPASAREVEGTGRDPTAPQPTLRPEPRATPVSPYRVPGPATRSTTGGLDRAVAYSLLGLGWTLFERGRYVDARRCFERALVVVAAASDPDAGDPWTSGRTAASLQVELLRGRAAVAVSLGHYDEASELYERAVAMLPDDDGLQRAALDIDVGWLQRCRGRYAEAEVAYNGALARLGAASEGRATIACALYESLAELRRRQGRLREAHRDIRHALQLADDCLGAEHPRVAGILAVGARIQAARSEFAEAERAARRCLALLRAGFGRTHPRFADGFVALAEVQLGRGQLGAAEQSFARALTLRASLLGDDHPELAEILDGQAAVLRATGREVEADRANARAADLRHRADA